MLERVNQVFGDRDGTFKVLRLYFMGVTATKALLDQIEERHCRFNSEELCRVLAAQIRCDEVSKAVEKYHEATEVWYCWFC